MTARLIRRLSFQLYSDMHLELWDKLPVITPTAPYLFLAGDISQYDHKNCAPFFDYCSKNWEKVFYVTGNHEYWNKKKSFGEIEFEYEHFLMAKYKNVFYLNNKSAPINDEIDVYGTTLWTKPTGYDTRIMKDLMLADYSNIKYWCATKKDTFPITSGFIRGIADDQLEKLLGHIHNSSKKTIIMTHFPPIQSGTSNPKYGDQPRGIKDYFAWHDLLHNIPLRNIPLWMSGHTHYSYDIMYKNTRLLSNQMGYKSEFEHSGINEMGTFEIEY